MVTFNAGISGVSKVQYASVKKTSGGDAGARVRPESVRSDLMNLSVQTLGVAQTDLGNQTALFRFDQLPAELKQELVYEGRPISEFSPQEAADLISEDGYFGVAKTSARIADFVINMAGDDLEKLKVGRDAVLRGFKEAEKIWGGQLPEISYQTLDKTLGHIDDKINDLGGSVVDLTA